MMTPEKKKRWSNILSAWVISLGATAIGMLVLEKKGLIEKQESQFVSAALLAGICLSFAAFAVFTKSAPFRGGMADKEESPFSYYLMTTIWFLAFIFFVSAALRKYLGSP